MPSANPENKNESNNHQRPNLSISHPTLLPSKNEDRELQNLRGFAEVTEAVNTKFRSNMGRRSYFYAESNVKPNKFDRTRDAIVRGDLPTSWRSGNIYDDPSLLEEIGTGVLSSLGEHGQCECGEIESLISDPNVSPETPLTFSQANDALNNLTPTTFQPPASPSGSRAKSAEGTFHDRFNQQELSANKIDEDDGPDSLEREYAAQIQQQNAWLDVMRLEKLSLEGRIDQVLKQRQELENQLFLLRHNSSKSPRFNFPDGYTRTSSNLHKLSPQYQGLPPQNWIPNSVYSPAVPPHLTWPQRSSPFISVQHTNQSPISNRASVSPWHPKAEQAQPIQLQQINKRTHHTISHGTPDQIPFGYAPNAGIIGTTNVGHLAQFSLNDNILDPIDGRPVLLKQSNKRVPYELDEPAPTTSPHPPGSPARSYIERRFHPARLSPASSQLTVAHKRPVSYDRGVAQQRALLMPSVSLSPMFQQDAVRYKQPMVPTVVAFPSDLPIDRHSYSDIHAQPHSRKPMSPRMLQGPRNITEACLSYGYGNRGFSHNWDQPHLRNSGTGPFCSTKPGRKVVSMSEYDSHHTLPDDPW